MNHLKSIAHVCIKSPDLARTLDFYCGGLGLARQFNFTRQGRVIGFYLQLAERSFIEVFEAEDAEPTLANAGLHHYCLETDHMEAVRRRLVEWGFEPGEVRKGADESLQFWVTDPSGVRFEFHQYTDRSAQFDASHRDVEVTW